MIVITNRIPLRTLYPKPPEKCGIITGNLDNDDKVTDEELSKATAILEKAKRRGQRKEQLRNLNNFIMKV